MFGFVFLRTTREQESVASMLAAAWYSAARQRIVACTGAGQGSITTRTITERELLFDRVTTPHSDLFAHKVFVIFHVEIRETVMCVFFPDSAAC